MLRFCNAAFDLLSPWQLFDAYNDFAVLASTREMHHSVCVHLSAHTSWGEQ